MKNLKQIKVVPTSVQVANSLRSAILAHEFKKDDVINLNATAAKLGVSNTPVREALQILAQDGLVVLRPNKGAVVLGMTKQSIRDYYETRIILESAAARKACQAEDLSQIEEAFMDEDAVVQQGEFFRYSKCNRVFHGAIWDTTENEKLISLMSSLWNTTSRAVHSAEGEYVLMAHEEHRRLKEAIMDRNVDLAAECLEKHLTRSMLDVMTRFEDE